LLWQLSVETTLCAETGFSRHLNFRLFQQYPRKAVVADDGGVDRSWP
jgi:hypothetical protein